MSDKPSTGDASELLGPFDGTITSFKQSPGGKPGTLGRVELDNGLMFADTTGRQRDPFLHMDALIAAGLPAILQTNPNGIRVRVFLKQDANGSSTTNLSFIDDVAAMAEVRSQRIGDQPLRANHLDNAIREKVARPENIVESGVTGTVKFYNIGKGFGFIQRDDGKPDEYLHAVHLPDGVVYWEGQRLQFDVAHNPQKPGKKVAVNMLPTDIVASANTITAIANVAASAAVEMTADIPTSATAATDVSIDPEALRDAKAIAILCVGMTADKQPIFVDDTKRGEIAPYDTDKQFLVDSAVIKSYPQYSDSIKVGQRLENIAGIRFEDGSPPTILPSSYIRAIELKKTGQIRAQAQEQLRTEPATLAAYSSEGAVVMTAKTVVVEVRRGGKAIRKPNAGKSNIGDPK
ncbi:MAG: cold shock domain-containing protein [Alphaproteobacteria bacterium]|nr:cold shock domain-containing protein [Alphaproteobacteria bacterium]